VDGTNYSGIAPAFQAWTEAQEAEITALFDNLEAAPEEVTLDSLAHLPRWIPWREEMRKGKPVKVPYSAQGRGEGETDNPATWGTRAQAEARAKTLLNGSRKGGIGIVMGELADGSDRSLGGIDLDTCRDAAGAFTPWANEVRGRVYSYAEVSPSGTGAKAFFTYRPKDLPALRAAMGSAQHRKSWKHGTGEHPPGIELHLTNSYFTVTGDRLDDAPAELHPVSQADLLWLIREAGPAFASTGTIKPAATVTKARDTSRSGLAFGLARRMKREGKTFEDYEAALADDPELADWADDERQVKRAWDNAPELAETPKPAPSGLRFLSPDECEAAPRGDYVVKGMLAPGNVAAIIGEPGTGKSLIAPYMGYRAALGLPVFGMRTRQSGVFYVAAEDPHGMAGRVAALKLEHGDAPGFELVTGLSGLLTEDSADLAALLAAVEERKPALIFLDTVQMAFPGLEENEAAPMGRVVRVARDLAQHGAAVVLLHHPAKGGDTPRGHGGLNGALDVSLFLTGQDATGIIRGRLKKNRNGTSERDIAFRIGVRELGTDSDGDAITAALVEELVPGSVPRGERPTPAEAAALAVLRELIGPETDSRTSEQQWRQECTSRRSVSGSDKPNSQWRAMDRAVSGLVRKGLVEVRDGLAWAPVGAIEADFEDDE
jgi:hypothetical protein